MSAIQESIQLDAPGAGLPKPELFIARLRFGWFRKKVGRAGRTALFEEERKRMLEIVGGLGDEEAAAQVLIRRIRGMEDSSRDWSVFMVLEHLRIVNELIATSIRALGRGEVPDWKADTAAVKPTPGVGREVVEGFEKSCAAILDAVGGVADLRTEVTYTHPWFGEMDAGDWHALAAVHMGIHRRQIERILETRVHVPLPR